jgi:hypothetical protein
MTRTAQASLAVAALAGVAYAALSLGAAFVGTPVRLATGVALAVAAVAKVVLAVAPLRLAPSRVPAVRGLLAVLAVGLTAYGTVLVDARPLAGAFLALWGLALGLGLALAGGSVVRSRPAAGGLGVAAAPLLGEPALLARTGGPGGPSDGWRRGERLAEDRRDAFARRDAVASL